MSLPRYPEYKDSGVAWLGKVPRHWEVMPFKWAIDRNDSGVWGDDPDGENDTIVLRSTEQTVDGNWIIEDPAPRKLSGVEKMSALLLAGDLLVTKSSGSSLHIGKTTLVTAEIAVLTCCYSNFMQRIRTKLSFNPKFAWYVMNNDIARLQFDYLSNSTTGLANLNGAMVGQLLLTIPMVEEQQAIVSFLDRETGKIDALIAEQRRLVGLLAEKRQAVISHTVIKGLNPNATMKDFGIEWLGEVPEHWEVVPLKHVIGQIESGVSVNASDQSASEYELGVLKTSCVYSGKFDANENKTVIEAEIDRVACPLKAGTIIVSRMNTPELVGAAGLVKFAPQNIYLPDRLWQVSFSSAAPAFVHYWTQSVFYRAQIRVVCAGTSSSMQNLGQDQFRSFDFPNPPQAEQEAIATFLDTETAKFDTLTAEANRAIALLQERRSALISAAVTGKIDVRSLTLMQEAA